MANAAQIDYWNVTAGPEWVRRQAFFDAMLAPFGAAAIDAADLAPGQQVIDVGCGCGTTTIDLARRVGPDGHVLGVDVSAPMLGVARRRVTEARLDGTVALTQADAQEHGFAPGGADRLFSRMGVMFFDDPPRAFANLRRALAPDGRLAFACWQPLDVNEWMAIPLGALRTVVALPAPAPPHAPGPFAFGQEGYVRDVLARAGWVDIEVEPRRERLVVGGDEGVAGAVAHVAELNVTRTALADVDEVTRTRALAAMRAALQDHADDSGRVRMQGCAWLVRARPG